MQSNCLVSIVGFGERRACRRTSRARRGLESPGWFAELDLLLRGDLTRVSSLRSGGLEINPRRLSLIIIRAGDDLWRVHGNVRRFPAQGSDLRLISPIKSVDEIPRGGKDLVIVADVDHVLHFRMLGGDGTAIVNTDEKKLPGQARQIEGLRTQLMGLWPPHELTESDKARVTSAVTSIVGHAQPRSADPMQVLASMLKVPLLFYLTLLVTFPSLYVFNALVGSRLSSGTVVRLLVASLGVMVTVLSVAGADRGVLLGEHGQLSVHAPVQRRRVYRGRDARAWRSCCKLCIVMSVVDSQPLARVVTVSAEAEPESLVCDDARRGARSA